ncbi:MAG: energy-coupling factor transporter transmembrane protein EcfT [Bacilli bacterium]|nr:energy-coupling factor transporter transmembrane protein EcfT [Bacilli bacterium]
MLDNIKLGQYLHGDSWYYRLDPRGKLVMSTFFIVIIFMANNWITYLAATLFTLLIVLTSGVPLKYFYRSIKPIVVLIFFTFFLNLFFYRTGTPLPPLNIIINKIIVIIYGVFVALLITFRFTKVIDRYIIPKIFKITTLVFILINILLSYGLNYTEFSWSFHWIIYKNALINGGYIILRLILIISMSSLLTFTTKPTDLTLAIEHVLSPLKIFKFPVSELALMISISLRFIPTLLEETQKVLKAQTSRGADFTEGNIKDKVIQIISLLVPMFIISFKRAEELANAMEARGYIPGRKRTSLRELRWRFTDNIYVLSFILLTAFFIYFRS